MQHISLARFGDISMFDIDPSNSWVLVLINCQDFIWLADHLFPSEEDACRWGNCMKMGLKLCVNYRVIRLREVLASNSLAAIIYHL